MITSIHASIFKSPASLRLAADRAGFDHASGCRSTAVLVERAPSMPVAECRWLQVDCIAGSESSALDSLAARSKREPDMPLLREVSTMM
jgi:hypothetical protein